MKSRRSRSQRVTVKQGINLQYAVAAGCALAAVVGVAVFVYLNLGNSEDSLAANARFYAVRPGQWSAATTWEGSVAPPAAEVKHDVEVLDHTVRRGHLSYRKGSKRTLTVKDTLVVEGNLTLGNKSNLIVNEGGVLMVAGNFTVDKKSEITNYGTIAVGGNWRVRSLDKVTYLGDSSRLFHLGQVLTSDGPTHFGQEGAALRQEHAGVYAQVKRQHDALQPILFTAHLQQDGVVTQWVAEGETASFRFAVERSTNGMLFETLTTMGDDAHRLMPSQRTYTDDAPSAGVSYYRLKRTAPDGHLVYSKLVMVVNSNGGLSMR